MRIMFIGNSTLYNSKLVQNISNLNSVSIEFCTCKSSNKDPLTNYSIKNTKPIWTKYRFPLQISREAKKLQPDIIHIQFEYSGIQGMGSKTDIILLPILLFIFKFLKIRTVITMHSTLSKEELKEIYKSFLKKTPPILLYYILKTFTKITSSLCNTIIVHLNSIKEVLHDEYHVPLDKLCVIPHGVDMMKPELNPSINEKYFKKFINREVVLFFGVLSPRKGIEFLLEAFSKIKNNNLVLVIVGGESINSSGFVKKLLTLCKKLQLEKKVIFTGQLGDDDVHSLFNLAKIIVFPYQIMPVASGAMSWAMQHRKPVIATKTKYFKENFEDNKDVILVDYGEPANLAKKISLLIKNEDLRKNLSDTLYKRTIRNSWENIAQKHLDIFRVVSK